jgi:hypothetical protein
LRRATSGPQLTDEADTRVNHRGARRGEVVHQQPDYRSLQEKVVVVVTWARHMH